MAGLKRTTHLIFLRYDVILTETVINKSKHLIKNKRFLHALEMCYQDGGKTFHLFFLLVRNLQIDQAAT